ncbi:hypothetical protein ABZZ74_50130 [Streptomyces sp. NPDC006476]|uniref:hypothetical protein n=1 Tax=Streptomyces sp. NPDC006476 TaxID=3157175 RepID=UPI0033A71F4A
MILSPPSLGAAQQLPHWPYLEAVDDALSLRGIPPGTVRADYRPPRFGDRLFIVLGWDTSRTAEPAGGIRLDWDEDTGWAYSLHGLILRAGARRPLTVLHRVYAAPEDVAAVAEQFVGHGRLPAGEYGAEWPEASKVRATIGRFRATLQEPDGLWTGPG